ncbi:hypothetical protein J6590_102441, partial [Homalodisca vitripennis]
KEWMRRRSTTRWFVKADNVYLSEKQQQLGRNFKPSGAMPCSPFVGLLRIDVLPAVDVAIMASRSLNDVAISDVLGEDSFIGVDSIFDDSDIDPDLMEED